MEFKERSMKVVIDTSKCSDCISKACIEACKTYDRELLQLKDGKPSVEHISADEVLRRGTECLACEYACWKRGKDVIYIDIPIKGLAEYIQGLPLSGGK
ncbi:MAG: hypothetical protein NTW48_02070 [Chloroflexi bacterium]|nr:hypothetical protein [Chloroflexota bacterium]